MPFFGLMLLLAGIFEILSAIAGWKLPMDISAEASSWILMCSGIVFMFFGVFLMLARSSGYSGSSYSSSSSDSGWSWFSIGDGGGFGDSWGDSCGGDSGGGCD